MGDPQSGESLCCRNSPIWVRALSPVPGSPAWESGMGRKSPQSIWLWRAVGLDCRSPSGLGETETPCLEGKSSDSIAATPCWSWRVSWRGEGKGGGGGLSRVLHELWLEADILGHWYQDPAPPTAWKLQCWDAQTPQNHLYKKTESFPGGPVVNNPPANAKDTGSIPGLGRLHMPRGN